MAATNIEKVWHVRHEGCCVCCNVVRGSRIVAGGGEGNLVAYAKSRALLLQHYGFDMCPHVTTLVLLELEWHTANTRVSEEKGSVDATVLCDFGKCPR